MMTSFLRLTAFFAVLIATVHSYSNIPISRIIRTTSHKSVLSHLASSSSRISSSLNDNTYGPACIILAGVPEKHLEAIDDIFAAALGSLPPVVIVSDRDFSSKVTLRKLLDDREARDHALGAKLCQVPSPVIFFAGCDKSAIRLSIQSYKTWNPPQSGAFPKTAFAVVVEKALDKTMEDLCAEILGDFTAEQAFKKSQSSDAK